jgi:Cdc6-like AAA superfamily ATPase
MAYYIQSSLNENLLVTKEDSYINFNKFRSGDSNICFVTGISGSGKSVLSTKLASEYNAVLYRLDDFDFFCPDFKGYNNIYKNDSMFRTFINKNRDFRFFLDSNFAKNMSKDIIKNFFIRFIPFIIEWCETHKSFKFVVEGIQIFIFSNPKELRKYPIIIKNSSVKKSLQQKKERDSYKASDIVKDLPWEVTQDILLSRFRRAVGG